REDTVLFPALHSLVSKHEYDAMGEEFERIERKTFGGDGFDMAVDQVTELERQFGIYDISQFTPAKSQRHCFSWPRCWPARSPPWPASASAAFLRLCWP